MNIKKFRKQDKYLFISNKIPQNTIFTSYTCIVSSYDNDLYYCFIQRKQKDNSVFLPTWLIAISLLLFTLGMHKIWVFKHSILSNYRVLPKAINGSDCESHKYPIKSNSASLGPQNTWSLSSITLPMKRSVRGKENWKRQLSETIADKITYFWKMFRYVTVHAYR